MADVEPLRDGKSARIGRLAPSGLKAERGGTRRGRAVPVEPEVVPGEVEGSRAGVSKETLRRLRRGDFPVEASLDLHGTGREDARRRVRGFVLEAMQAGWRVVSVIHGRGLRSPQGVPVLRPALASWLGSEPLAELVLAWTPAPLRHGGDGATLVLLRR